MIAHPHKTVFVHIPKTAGQSVEQVFLSYLGLDQLSRPALLLRKKRDYENGPPRLSHLTAVEYTQHGYLSEKHYAEYFSFTFVRNPWSRVRSFYLYLQFDDTMSFEEFVLDELATQMLCKKYGWFLKPQVEYVFDVDGQKIVDFVGRFETLQANFDTVMERLNLPKTELPVMNSSRILHDKVSHPNRNAQYSAATIEKVAALYARDIEAFGYKFE